MRLQIAVTAVMIGAAFSANAASDELPPLTPDLLNVAGVACVRIGDDGSVTGAFLIGSTGDPTRDQHLVDWVQHLHWLPAKPGEKLRNSWFPMPVATGNARAPKAPDSCRPTVQAPSGSKL